MCGIVGQLGRASLDPERWIDQATAVVAHRGPDDHGTWSDPSSAIWLGHRRLSIVDLGPGGHQPLETPSGQTVVSFNGEIYNHREVGQQLLDAGAELRSGSDTEVLACAVETWGVEAALRRCRGMFAFAAWDRHHRRLALARDRIGEKPLYVQHGPAGIRFASEMKSLLAAGAPVPAVDRRSLTTYLRYGYVPAPHSIFDGISKVLPGTIEWYEFDGHQVQQVQVERYWEAGSFSLRSDPGSLDDLEGRLRESVALQLQADVPVGAFLSGGIDSSLVVALAAEVAPRLRTFTIGFDAPEFDESGFAEAVARHLGTDHTTMQVTAQDTLDVVPSLARIYDEPFGDPSSIPTHLVAALAKQDVTVALSGDGGDELFGGYTRYGRVRAAERALGWVPRPVGAIAAKIAGLGATRWPPARTAERAGLALQLGGPAGLYKSLVSNCERPTALTGSVERPTAVDCIDGSGDELVLAAMDADLRTYLPDDILVKVDRASMDRSLEVRVPLLDASVIEWSRAHMYAHLQSGASKAPLRALLARRMPPALFDRPKAGFGVPIRDWLRVELREWAGDLLARDALGDSGISPDAVGEMWQTHLRGEVDLSFPLWTVLMFQAWRTQWVGA